MNNTQTKPSEIQFIVGEDWSFGPSMKLVAIPVINGDITKETIGPDGIVEVASRCAKELHSCLILCEETPFIEPDYLRKTGDERAKYIMTPRDERVYHELTKHFSSVCQSS